MRRHFVIAFAFLEKPQLVIVDEPTAGLDPLEHRRFQHILCPTLFSTLANWPEFLEKYHLGIFRFIGCLVPFFPPSSAPIQTRLQAFTPKANSCQ